MTVNATWKFYVDWNNDGDYGEAGENITDYVMSADWSYGRDTSRPVLGYSNAGTCNILLLNTAGRFCPFNSASPLYGNLLPRRKLKITATYGWNGWTYSQTFENAAWTKTNCTADDAGSACPDGFFPSTKYVEDNTAPGSDLYISRAFPTLTDNTVCAVSLYAKAAERTWIWVETQDKAGTLAMSYVNLSTGATGTVHANHTLTVETIGSGWYRIKILFDPHAGATAPTFYFGTATGNNAYVTDGDGTSGMLVWGLQAEADSAVVREYDHTEATAHPVESTQWTGFVDSIMPLPSLSQDHKAQLRALGPLSRVAAADASINFHTGSVTPADLIDDVLDAIDWPAGDRALDTAVGSVNNFYSNGKRGALNLIREIESTAGGFVRETKDGKIAYEKPTHYEDHVMIYSFGDTSGSWWVNYCAVRQEDPLREIYNSIKARVTTFGTAAAQLLWTLNSVPEIAAGATLTIWATFPNASTTDFTQVAVSDWDAPTFTANSLANGTGDDETANVAIVATEFDNSCKLAITNNAAHAVFITDCHIHGTAITQADDHLYGPIEDATSITAYERRPYQYDLKWISTNTEADTLCDLILARGKDPRAIATLTFIANTNYYHLQAALETDVSDAIYLKAGSGSGLYFADRTNFTVQHIQVRLTQSKEHFVTYTLRNVVVGVG